MISGHLEKRSWKISRASIKDTYQEKASTHLKQML